jgi:tetratricopeptide (TPR) repeat protein
MGWYYANQQYDEAKSAAHRILEMNPQWVPALDMMRRLAAVENRPEDAVDAGRKYWQAWASMEVPENLTYEEFLDWENLTLERMAREGHVRATELAISYAEMGNKDKTLEWLKVAEEKNESVIHLLFYPEFELLRNDPRFEEFVSRIKLPVKFYCEIGDA